MKTHIIRWVSSVTGGIGAGKTLFEKEDAERLAEELNSNYPDIDHKAVPAVASTDSESAAPDPCGSSTAMESTAPVPQMEAGLPKPNSVAALSS